MAQFNKLPISETDKALLTSSAANQMRFLGLEYSILSQDEKSITVLVRQKRLINDKVLSKTELIERAKEFLKVESLPPNMLIHARPIVHNITDSEVVTQTWIKEKMHEKNLKLKNLVEMLGIDKSTLSELLSGNTNLTKWHKATFYYFFSSISK